MPVYEPNNDNRKSEEDCSDLNQFENLSRNALGDNKTQKLSDITTKTGKKQLVDQREKSAKSL